MKGIDREQEQKFTAQLNQLPSFIGMPIRHGYKPTLSQIREHDRRILENQALGFKSDKYSERSRLMSKLANMHAKLFEQVQGAASQRLG